MDAIETTIAASPTEAEALVREALRAQGFGVLTEIDLAGILKAKLGVDRPPLKILGACNPALAERALRLDPSAGLLLPCNVVLEAEGEGTRVLIADPRQLLPGPELAPLAAEAAGLLTAVRDALALRS